MTPEHRKAHRDEIVALLKRTDIQAIQGAPVTEDMINRAWNRIPEDLTNPTAKTVTPQQLEAHADHARHVETHLHQLRTMEAQQNYEAMSDDERSLLASEQLVELSRAKLAKARSMRQHAAVERYELELEQREAVVTDQKSRLAKLAERRSTDLVLQNDPDFAYALTSAEINRDVLDPMSDDAIQNSVYINAMKSATPANYKTVLKEFHQFEAARFARIAQEKQAAEAAALQFTAPGVREWNQLGVDASQAALDSAERLARSQRLSGPGDLN